MALRDSNPQFVPGPKLPNLPAAMSFDQTDQFSVTREHTPAGALAPDHSVALEDVPPHVRDIAALRGLGFSFREIGLTYGVTPQGVSIMLFRQRELMKTIRRNSDLAGLSPRAVNALGRIGINSREAARQSDQLEGQLMGLRNCGRKTRQEILAWAGDGEVRI